MHDVEVVLERTTANDETASIVAVYVTSGTIVAVDELLFDFENSKATQELRSPAAGMLLHQLAVGDVVGFGVRLASISGTDRAAPPLVASLGASVGAAVKAKDVAPVNVSDVSRPRLIATTSSSKPGDGARPGVIASLRGARFSRTAGNLVVELGLTPTDFEPGFVTSEMVVFRARQARPADETSICRAPSVQAKSEVSTLTQSKRAEIRVLLEGAGSSSLSVLGVNVGPVVIRRPEEDFLSERITDIVIYESARLLRKYPKLNACFEGDSIVFHAAAHAGIAIDGGGKLVVYGIKDADRASLQHIAAEIADASARYATNEFSAEELSRATFTVSDLSGCELDYMLPLLPRGQSCIIGVTRDRNGTFRIYGGFDHRVTEGREVASFLTELAERIRSFGEQNKAEAQASARCHYCDRGLDEASGKGRGKGLLKIVGSSGVDIVCCASCWNGW